MLGALADNLIARTATSLTQTPVCVLILGVALLPVGCGGIAGTLACILQAGGLTLVGIEPKLERLAPIEGLKRICSRETIAHSLRAVLAFTCAALAMAPILAAGTGAMLHSAGVYEAASGAWKATQEVAIAAVAVGLIFSIAEYAAARSTWLRKLRMSCEDRKREAKEEEGDGFSRGRRRAMHRALVRSGMQRIKDAAFVVSNPAHVAIALSYRPPDVPVPRVLVRATDELALRVRQLARRYRIPIVENVSLARALYHDCRIGEPIPQTHYVAVAEVVAALTRSLEIAP